MCPVLHHHPSNSFVEILPPNMTVLGGGAFERWLGHKGGPLLNGTSALMKRTPESPSPLSAIWGYGQKTPVCEPGDTRSAGALSMDFLASRTVRKKFLFFVRHPAYGSCYGSLNGLRQGDTWKGPLPPLLFCLQLSPQAISFLSPSKKSIYNYICTSTYHLL